MGVLINSAGRVSIGRKAWFVGIGTGLSAQEKPHIPHAPMHAIKAITHLPDTIRSTLVVDLRSTKAGAGLSIRQMQTWPRKDGGLSESVCMGESAPMGLYCGDRLLAVGWFVSIGQSNHHINASPHPTYIGRRRPWHCSTGPGCDRVAKVRLLCGGERAVSFRLYWRTDRLGGQKCPPTLKGSRIHANGQRLDERCQVPRCCRVGPPLLLRHHGACARVCMLLCCRSIHRIEYNNTIHPSNLHPHNVQGLVDGHSGGGWWRSSGGVGGYSWLQRVSLAIRWCALVRRVCAHVGMWMWCRHACMFALYPAARLDLMLSLRRKAAMIATNRQGDDGYIVV